MLSKNVKHRAIWILMLMTAAVGIVSLLAWDALRPVSEAPAFYRMYTKSNPSLANAISKPSDVLDIVGYTKYSVFFRTKDPTKVFVLNHNLTGGKYWQLPIKVDDRVKSLYRLSVDSPRVTIFAGNSSSIVRWEPDNKLQVKRIAKELFTNAVPLSENTFAFRMYDGLDQIFAKGNLYSNTVLKEESISPKNGDAGISTDGAINHDPKTNQIIYVQYYNSEIIVLDTNLSLTSKMSTIDRSSASIKVGYFKSRSQLTSLGPKRMINPYSTIYDGKLFINSLVPSNKQNKELFDTSSVIDVYDLSRYKYLYSFNTKLYKSEKIRCLRIIDGLLLLITKNYIASYNLNLN